MIETALTKRQASLRTKITVKSLVSLSIVVLAVALPQLAHLAVGAQAGIMLLPMYLPVLLGGCILGWRWGVAAGMLSPLVSFLITSAAGNAMPAAARLPFMMAELAVFALVSGMFSKQIERRSWVAFPAVIEKQILQLVDEYKLKREGMEEETVFYWRIEKGRMHLAGEYLAPVIPETVRWFPCGDHAHIFGYAALE